MTKKRLITLCSKFAKKYDFNSFKIDKDLELIMMDEDDKYQGSFSKNEFLNSELVTNWANLQNRIDKYYKGKKDFIYYLK